MSKRLQVLLDEDELAEIQEFARRNRMTVAEWVRGALREARSQASTSSPGRKLEAILQAYNHHGGPSVDIGQMLSEIESGYLES